ncbi:hypothetical protein ACIBCH_14915 [Amycolatopsis thailandensis]|uniref:hypothetical protein n=1 Tax=Amycolatopsis thailandensis TaxID=589330 RepID=UPI0037A03BF2
MTEGAYSFLPWLRAGLSTRIVEPPGIERATIPVRLELNGEALTTGGKPPHAPVTQPVQLYGPGDVIGVDPRAISRTEPQPFSTNFEPNYLAHIEFYQEEFAWRYSPDLPDATTRRLAPWLALIVLADGGESGVGEFEEGVASGEPLPFIAVTAPEALQPPGELGAWAHVHVNGALDEPLAIDDPRAMGTSLSNLGKVLRDAPDSACCRVVCPRHLKANTAYHAFLVPAFETGRQAGLGLIPANIRATTASWGPGERPLAGRLPYYHRWSFVTSTKGDFEDLVRLLKPVEAKDPTGLRDMDAHRATDFALPELTTPTRPSGVLRLGGALRLVDSDKILDGHENWDNYYGPQPPPAPPLPPMPPYPNEWQRAMAGLINLAESYQHQPAAAANTELAAQVTDLAGQVDPVITPPLYGRWHALTPTLITRPDGTAMPPAELHNWVHRLNLDPRFRVAAHFGTKVVQDRQEELMASAWEQLGEAQRANTRIRAAQLAREIGNVLHAKHITPQAGVVPSAADAEPLRNGRALTLTAPAHPKVLDVPGRVAAAGETLAVGFKVSQSRVASAPVSPTMRRVTRPGARLVKTLRTSLDTLVTRIDEAQVHAAPPLGTPPGLVTAAQLAARLPATTADGVLAQALRETRDGFRAAAANAADERPKLHVTDTTTSVVTGLNADTTVMNNIVAAMNLPDRLAPEDGELAEVMAYPVFDMPMYADLVRMSTDTFVPNLGQLPPNSVTLLENNRRFIESYLVGLNHEMAREMLWREFPTDLRGTPFRQFWDPRTAPAKAGEKPAARLERLYDIPPIHRWGPTARLGENPNPKPKPGDPPRTEDLVLVIRGELLKKYPNTVVYAHKAAWPDLPGKPGQPDKSGERELAKLPTGEDPPHDLVRLPIYEAKVEPDIYLLGFELDAKEARGKGANLGWFFVLKECPGEPRFGVDEDRPGEEQRVEVWNDLTWGRVDPGASGFIRFDAGAHVTLDKFNGDKDDQEKGLQRLDDEQVKVWHSEVSSADVAYILFQAPVLVAMHAQEMLPDDPAQP